MALLEASDLWKEFHQPGQDVVALRALNLTVAQGDFLVVTGESGSGKSTLLSLLSGLDRPTRGTVRFRGESLGSASSGRLARIRRDQMGFVFQDFRLVRHLSVLGNVRLPLLFTCNSDGDAARRLVERVNLSHRIDHRPDALSRGEMQRAAIARALINQPDVLFADEPTANLDRRNSDLIWDLLRDLHSSQNLTLVVATHNAEPLRKDGRIVQLDDGSLVTDET